MSNSNYADDGRWLGPNAWLVDEMYERYRADPTSVSESWQEFFADYHHRGLVASRPEPPPAPSAAAPVPAPSAPAPAGAAPRAPVAVAAPFPTPEKPTPEKEPAPQKELAKGPADAETVPLRGAAARIVANMVASLAVPTATSVRVVPAGLLEVNRRILNNQLARVGGGKVSVTHLLGFAIVQAVKTVPAMNSTFVAGDPPGVIHHPHVGLGLAVDQKRADGSRTLLVPV